jgi:hypothetical protein
MTDTQQMHTLLCLMAKGAHLEERREVRESVASRKKHAYKIFAEDFNFAISSDTFYGLPEDLMFKQKKGVVGRGGYIERSSMPRVTRALKLMWLREPGFDYDGTLGEWNTGRKEREAEKRSIAAGGTPREVVTNTGSDDGDSKSKSSFDSVEIGSTYWLL